MVIARTHRAVELPENGLHVVVRPLDIERLAILAKHNRSGAWMRFRRIEYALRPSKIAVRAETELRGVRDAAIDDLVCQSWRYL